MNHFDDIPEFRDKWLAALSAGQTFASERYWTFMDDAKARAAGGVGSFALIAMHRHPHLRAIGTVTMPDWLGINGRHKETGLMAITMEAGSFVPNPEELTDELIVATNDI